MTRSRLIVLAVAIAATSIMLGSAVIAQSSQFDDVPTDHYAHDAVEWAVDNRITVGCDGTNFCPDDSLTRAHLAAMLYRFAHNVGVCRSYRVSGIGNETQPVGEMPPGAYRSVVDLDVPDRDDGMALTTEGVLRVTGSSVGGGGGKVEVYRGSLFDDEDGTEGPTVYVTPDAAPSDVEVLAGMVTIRPSGMAASSAYVRWVVTLEGAC